MIDYGDGAESDASTMTSASGAGYYDADSQRNSRSRCPTVMSPESIATRSSSVPGKHNSLLKSCTKLINFLILIQYFPYSCVLFISGQARYVRPQFLNTMFDPSSPGASATSPGNFHNYIA